MNDIVKPDDFAIIEQVVMQGDLSKLSPQQRVTYYNKVCESCGLNPLTNPFSYISLNGKLTLYAKKDCTEQLRKIHGVSIENLDYKVIEDLYIVTAKAKDKHGRLDQAQGAVALGNLKGEAKANAVMKAETKAKRRVTLSICGMGWTDESEIESIPNAKTVEVDLGTGEIRDVKPVSTYELCGGNVALGIDVKPEQKEAPKPLIARPEDVETLLSLLPKTPKEFQNNFWKLTTKQYGDEFNMSQSYCDKCTMKAIDLIKEA